MARCEEGRPPVPPSPRRVLTSLTSFNPMLHICMHASSRSRDPIQRVYIVTKFPDPISRPADQPISVPEKGNRCRCWGTGILGCWNASQSTTNNKTNHSLGIQ